MQQQQDAANASADAPQKKKKIFPIILAILIIGGGGFGVTKYIHSLHHQETDDAQVDGNISPVITRVSGYVSEVRVKDFQLVKKGDTLLVLDNRDLVIKLHQAEAALAAAQSGMSAAEATATSSKDNIISSQANVATLDAQIEAAKVNAWRAKQDYERYSNLIKDHSITEQQYEQASATKETTERQLQMLQQQRIAAKQQSSAVTAQSHASKSQVGVANATIAQRKAEVENAALNLSYSVIVAAEDGQVSKINAQVGQYLNAGQALFNLVLDNSIWVTANYKETQLTKMKDGQVAVVHVDAFPGVEFKGKVTSFSPATGAKFSLLPPDNASGNFVKVVQRVPVKIEFTDNDKEQLAKLRPGMNVEVDVLID
jgi:membrane fusion protein (multidrug efflux system)